MVVFGGLYVYFLQVLLLFKIITIEKGYISISGLWVSFFNVIILLVRMLVKRIFGGMGKDFRVFRCAFLFI